MNLVAMNSEKTMSSREIAKLTDKAHRNVTADIVNMINDLGLSIADFSAVYIADNNQKYVCYNLPKRECLILVSGYSISLRAKIIDRWQELESQQVAKVELPDFTQPAIAARAWAEQYEKAQTLAIENKEQAKQLEEAAPALKFVSDFVVAKGDVSLRQAAKELMQSPMAFNRQLAELGIIYKLGDTWTAKQSHINAGRLVMKAILCDDGEHRPQCNVTPKGIEYIAQRLAELNQE